MPEQIRPAFSRWGMCKDEFTTGNGGQEQRYVREARRMVSDYVMTQHNCQGRIEAEDALGLDPAKLPALVIDDPQAVLQGFATLANVVGPFVAWGYRHDGTADPGQQSAQFPLCVDKDGKYEFRAGQEYAVEISSDNTVGYVLVAAVQLVPAGEWWTSASPFARRVTAETQRPSPV